MSNYLSTADLGGVFVETADNFVTNRSKLVRKITYLLLQENLFFEKTLLSKI